MGEFLNMDTAVVGAVLLLILKEVFGFIKPYAQAKGPDDFFGRRDRAIEQIDATHGMTVDLHEWSSKTDANGRPLMYSNGATLEKMAVSLTETTHSQEKIATLLDGLIAEQKAMATKVTAIQTHQKAQAKGLHQ
jgi:hypothetical protein